MKCNIFIALVIFMASVTGFNGVLAQSMVKKEYNFTTFSPQKSDVTSELLKLVPSDFHNHPEFGILPYNAPCDNCIELIHLRTDSTRMFVEKGSEGTKFYSQASYGQIHYLDELNNFRTYDSRLSPSQSTPLLFESKHQDFPMKVDVLSKNTSFLLPNGDEIKQNKNLKLLFKPESGFMIDLGYANWEHFTVGDDGVYIYDAWSGIDIQIISGYGELKTNYIVKQNPGYANGFFIIEDYFEAPNDYQLEMHEIFLENTDNHTAVGSLKMLNSNGDGIYIDPAFGYDQSGIKENSAQFAYKIESGNKLQIWVPVNWFNQTTAQYPMIIDPVVTSSATYTAGIMRYRINGSFCAGPNADCMYTLAVPRPANSTLTAANFSLVQETLAGTCLFACWMSDAGFYFQTTCGVDGYWGCGVNNPGTCTATNLDISGLISCLAPACSGNVNFNIFNSYCYCNTNGNCGNSCQRINNNTWIITLTGSTLETLGNTATGNGSQTINDADCIGTATLNPLASNGVPGYTYNWNTGATTSTINVPVTPAVYTATVTDACGNSVVATFNVGCPLPLRLENFSANQKENFVEINWTSLDESGMKNYILEHSIDGINFSAINSMTPKFALDNTYQYIHSSAANGHNYYRLKIIYESQEFEYSDQVSVYFNNDREIVISPNPASQNIRCFLFEPLVENSSVQLISSSGKIEFNYKFVSEINSKEFVVDISNLPTGIYTLKVFNGSKIITEQLVINR